MSKIYHVYAHYSSFVEKDNRLFSEHHKVVNFHFKYRHKTIIPLRLIQQFFVLLFSKKPDLYIIQFAGIHSFIPVTIAILKNKPSLIICGGNDCHSFPSIKYGNYTRKFLAWATSYSLRNCTHIAPKHESLWFSEYKYDSRFPTLQGIAAFNKRIKTPYTVIPNGYDASFWKKEEGCIRHKKSFITVSGNLHLPYQMELKGIDLIIQLANALPNSHFTIVGSTREMKGNFTNTANIRLIPKTSPKELKKLFSEHEYYLQLSLAEGFPNALCEAILCGCIPIGSDVFSIRDIIENENLILKKRNFYELLSQIKNIINADYMNVKRNIRLSLAHRFSETNRATKLNKLIKTLTS